MRCHGAKPPAAPSASLDCTDQLLCEHLKGSFDWQLSGKAPHTATSFTSTATDGLMVSFCKIWSFLCSLCVCILLLWVMREDMIFQKIKPNPKLFLQVSVLKSDRFARLDSGGILNRLVQTTCVVDEEGARTNYLLVFCGIIDASWEWWVPCGR